MSLTLLLICRQSIRLGNFSQLRTSLLRPVYSPSNLCVAQLSTLKSRYGSINPSQTQNPFQKPSDERTRRRYLQEHIRFREQFQLENDYELIFALPRQRMYGLLHLLCTCASISMFVFVLVHVNRDLIDLDAPNVGAHENIPPIVLYSVATIIGACFGLILVLISRTPTRLYYSSVRKSYALIYYPVIGVFRQKKILFNMQQYQIIPQQLDSINGPQRAAKIRIQFGTGLLKTRQHFYFIEHYFRSKRDVNRLRCKDIEQDSTTDENDKYKDEEDSHIWQTVVEKKDQPYQERPRQQRT
ncbi:unnamed protein product [Adineta ricciae]|uniref:Uncharacterized protein n=1 Tax=Adineta ricciae TaxID=249248 RepID=A0A815ZX53_ADIRI|nr:unnamed protein product [Adineta ricciae]